jgi:glutamate--cysteine ligase
MRSDFDGSYVRFMRAQSQATRARLVALPWSAEQQQRCEALAAWSVAERQRIEAADTLPFEVYRQEYLSPKRLGLPRAAA